MLRLITDFSDGIRVASLCAIFIFPLCGAGRAVQGVPLAAVAPAEAIAGAVRSIALGVRNDLDPDRFQERGLNRALR